MALFRARCAAADMGGNIASPGEPRATTPQRFQLVSWYSAFMNWSDACSAISIAGHTGMPMDMEAAIAELVIGDGIGSGSIAMTGASASAGVGLLSSYANVVMYPSATTPR